MIKSNLKFLLITSVIILLPIVAGLALWNTLPAQLPNHWNFAGEVDGWSSKPFAVFGMPLILLGVHWLGVVATFSDPKKINHTGKILHLVFWIVPVLSVVLHIFIFSTALGKNLPVNVILPALMGLLFVIIGNYLPKCKQNYTIGIKLPWTLHSEANWNRTHRAAGWLWVAGGLVVLATSFLGSPWIFLGAAAVMAIAPAVYSYVLHRKGV